MRCPSCNKFVSIDAESDPEVNSVEIDNTGTVTADVRIVNTCAECGEELREATFDFESDDDEIRDHITLLHTPETGDVLEAEEGDSTRFDESEGSGRGRRTYYGVDLTVKVTCRCGRVEKAGVVTDGTFERELTLRDRVQASHMEDLT